MRLQQIVDAVDVVEVTVGAQHVRDLDVETLGLGEDRGQVPRRIDHGHLARGFVPDEVDEVVPGPDLELMDEQTVRHQSNITTLRIDSPSCIRWKA